VVASSITEAVVGGVAPFPLNGVKKVVITYNAGHTLTLEGNALTVWFQEYLHMFAMTQQMERSGPVVPSEVIHDSFDDDE
jgi:hypothetical protein